MDYNKYARLFDSVCERMGGISVFSDEVDYMPEYMPVNLLFGLDCNERVREARYIAILCDIVEFFANYLY